jgi:predicted DNA-binding transcriptional regulator AlpA
MSPTKKAKARKRAVGAKAPREPGDDFSIDEWCAKRRITKPHFYELLKLRLAPKTMKLKKRRTISQQADAEWQAARERESEIAA